MSRRAPGRWGIASCVRWIAVGERCFANPVYAAHPSDTAVATATAVFVAATWVGANGPCPDDGATTGEQIGSTSPEACAAQADGRGVGTLKTTSPAVHRVGERVDAATVAEASPWEAWRHVNRKGSVLSDVLFDRPAVEGLPIKHRLIERSGGFH
jgi:hypothetical protein